MSPALLVMPSQLCCDGMAARARSKLEAMISHSSGGGNKRLIGERGRGRSDGPVAISGALMVAPPYDLSARARRVYEAAIPNALGQRIARTRTYEEALAKRGEAESVRFAQGTLDDWTSVALAP